MVEQAVSTPVEVDSTKRSFGHVGGGKIRTRTAIYLALEIILFTINLLLVVSFQHDMTTLAGCDDTLSDLTSRQPGGRRPIIRIVSKNTLDHHDIFVVDAFRRMGYTGSVASADGKRQWDALYTSFDPFHPEHIQMTKKQMLSSHQKINHIVGIRQLADPVKFFNQSKGLDFTLQTYVLPTHSKELLEEVTDNPDKVWVKSHSSLRQAKIVNSQDLDVSNMNNRNLIVQEFVGNPFVVDNRKFIISAFVLITSVNPLRVSMYDDLLIRYSNKNLFSFGLDHRDGLEINVVDKAFFWQMESMKKFGHRTDAMYKQRKMLEEHIREATGKDPFLLDQIHNAIEQVFLDLEGYFHDQLTSKLTNNHNVLLYEIMRWDFVMDDKTNLFLLKASISPAMTVNGLESDTAGFSLVQQMYFSMISIVGMSTNYISQNTPRFSSDRSRVRISDVFVYQDMCYTEQCSSCQRGCELCSQCLAYEDSHTLTSTYREQMNRQQFRRVVPAAEIRSRHNKADYEKDVFSSNIRILQSKWLNLKCDRDIYWCT